MKALKVIDIQPNTSDACLISLEIPDHELSTFRYLPGQYISIELVIDGERLRRCYSLCSSPLNPACLQISVKRVNGGKVSNYLNDQLKVGDHLSVQPPLGNFMARLSEGNYKTYFLFAAGSGITPILSILKSVLRLEAESYVHLLYGNKNLDSIMFKNELESLKIAYGERLQIVYSLSRAKALPDEQTTASYRQGRVDPETVHWFIRSYVPKAQNTEYYICGPGNMIHSTKQSLMEIDVPAERIFVESFGGSASTTAIKAIDDARLNASLGGQTFSTRLSSGKTILKGLLDAGANPPYSCEAGICGTCRCNVKQGKVAMKRNAILSAEELRDGWVLSCQSLPLTKEVEVVFE